MTSLTSTILKTLEAELPPLIARRAIFDLTGGLVRPKTLANEDSLGTGPKVRVRIGRNIAYERKSLIQWLRKKIVEIDYELA